MNKGHHQRVRPEHPHSDLIDRLGGTTRLAEICEISTQAVTGWRARGIPRPWLLWMELRFPARVAAWRQEKGGRGE